jgi:hypothetical protein
MVTRDRSHRGRSVQKGCWQLFNQLSNGLLSALTTDSDSLCRMLQTSRKYGLLFEHAQSDEFSKAIRNFSFAMQRMDSLSVPLLKIFHTLPAVLKFLCSLTKQGDREDQKWAIAHLSRLTGPDAYYNILFAALASDAFLLANRLIRMDDVAESTAVLKGSQAGFH